MENFNLIKFKMGDLRPLLIDNFFRLRDSFNIIFYVSLQSLSMSLIARMSSKLENIRTENRSFLKINNMICFCTQ